MAAATRRAAFAVAAAVALAATCGAANGQDITAGRAKAQVCAVCHGLVGIAVLPEAPNLAGQPAGYLVQQLRAYRSGARKNDMMALMAKPLSDDEIADLAAWFASIRVQTAPP